MHLQMPGQYPPPTLQSLISSLKVDFDYLKLPEETAFDYYGDFPKDSTTSYLRNFESELSTHLSLPDCVFMPSGVMAQSIMLMINARGEESSFCCHQTSHLLIHEKESYEHLLKLEPEIIDTQKPITYSDVLEKLNGPNSSKIKTVVLEHPHRELGGSLTSFTDLKKIQEICKQKNVKFHLDGARIWEASGAYNGEKSLKDITGCFDSCYVSFYKGLGGITGAALLGSHEFCEEARIWLRRFGGNLFCLSPYAVSCWAGFRRNVTECEGVGFVEKAEKMKRVVGLLKGDEEISSVLSFRTETVEICFCQGIIQGTRSECEKAEKAVFEETGVHVFSRLRGEFGEEKMYFEWNMGEVNGRIEDQVFLENWKLFARELKEK
ncbi:hypothetical protein TrLO_g1628 [Triparma laevis f. longispina]|uniref:Aromatic amino acid beta-eliminating lyase/threonine aldolase domain-containing protein n=1 Tax=Triparma laevis f. longispina TaxID=1714387 RepID=A0A9W7EBP0_9STRA|nr:hypothetical protein TrLO_g1628 [Triparma laevis f. longispina]